MPLLREVYGAVIGRWFLYTGAKEMNARFAGVLKENEKGLEELT